MKIVTKGSVGIVLVLVLVLGLLAQSALAIVKSDTQILSAGLTVWAKIATSGTTHAAIVRRTDVNQPVYAALYDDFGNYSTFDLTNTLVSSTAACAVELSSTNLYVLCQTSPGIPFVQEYRLGTTTPLPTNAVYITNLALGDLDSRIGELLKLTSGSVVAMVSQLTNNEESVFCIGYRNGSGVWTSQGKTNLFGYTSGTQTAQFSTMAQHPGDSNVWFFHTKDGSHNIDAFRFVDSGSALNWTQTYTNYIFDDSGSTETNGVMGPSGEMPVIIAVADAYRTNILIAYCNWTGDYVDDFICSPVVLVKVNTDGTRSALGVTDELMIHDDGGIAISVTANQINLFYPPIFEYIGNWRDRVSRCVWRDGALGPPAVATFTSNTGSSASTLWFNPSKPEMIVRYPNLTVHLLKIPQLGNGGSWLAGKMKLSGKGTLR